ncbi:MAG: hypothetical protein RL215_129 [Planctomycetota bacterium]
MSEAKTVEPEGEHHPECEKSVAEAATKVDAAGFVEIADRDGDITEPEAEEYRLGKELGVEDEIVGIELPGDGLKNFSAVGAEAAVKIPEILTENDVFENGQATIGDVLPCRHPALQCFCTSTDAGSKHDIDVADANEFSSNRNHSAVVLVVGMNHHDDISAAEECFGVAGFLVASVARVSLVLNDGQSQSPGYFDCLITTAVINEDNLIHSPRRDISEC